MQVRSIKETCLYFKDLEKARAFYNGILKLPIINYTEGAHIFFRAGASVLLCFNPEVSSVKESPPPHDGEGRLHFAFEVSDEDYLKYKKYIEDNEIEIIDTVIWQNGKESFYFKDPEENVCEIVPPGIWGY